MQAVIKVLDAEYAVECADCDQRRLEDLARALDQRLKGFAGETSAMRALVLTALALIDEAQATSAALALARCEIERLTDLLVDARLGAECAGIDSERGRVGALRDVQGGA